MQTWLLWNMIGLYPVTGQTTFLIQSPWYESLTINLGNGNTFIVTSTGGDGNGDTDYYVQSLKVNGQDWFQNWLTWDDVFAKGGRLDFVLGPEPVQWATGPLPPSPATEPLTCVRVPSPIYVNSTDKSKQYSNNCLRNLRNPQYSSSASAFCTTYLERVVTATSAIPTYINNCGAQPTSVSSACSCLLTGFPPISSGAASTYAVLMATATSS
jgi:hypothetical protein